MTVKHLLALPGSFGAEVKSGMNYRGIECKSTLLALSIVGLYIK